jgi:epoxyqueuosine reductase
VTSTDPFPASIATMQRRKEQGLSAGLGFTYVDPETAGDPRRSFPWARSIVVLARSYLPEAGSPGSHRDGTVTIARFATGDRYAPLREALAAIVHDLEASGYRAQQVVDDRRLIDRAAAVRAGVGWWGKSTMVLVPGAGPWVLLGSVVTDAVLVEDHPMARNCGTCTACLPACPTGAIVAPGVLDARLCLASWLQSSGVIPRGLRAAVGDRIYGCDDCLTSCPPGHRLLERSERPEGRVPLLEILGGDDATLLARFENFFIPGRRPRYLRRNAIVAAGNDGSEDLLAPLVGFLGHPDWLLRAHAAWAVGRFEGPIPVAALDAARTGERDPRVREEVDAARGAS